MASGLFYLVNDKGESKKMVKALTIRVGLSVLLFVLLLLAWSQGLIKPHGMSLSEAAASMRSGAAVFAPAANRRTAVGYSQYTNTNRPSHTTSTKCQYQATPSNAK